MKRKYRRKPKTIISIRQLKFLSSQGVEKSLNRMFGFQAYFPFVPYVSVHPRAGD